MNKRIKELIEQATAIIDVKCEGLMGRSYVIQEEFFDYAKFAELIVHQMLEITDAHTEVFQTDRDKALVEHIKQSVKQHFGVEE
jgi:hypothetical protein